MTRSLLIAALLGVALIEAANAKVGPQWIGTWKCAADGRILVIEPSTIEFTEMREVEPGAPREKVTYSVQWTAKSENLAGDYLYGVFSYSKKRISPQDISQNYERALRQFQRDPVDYHVTEPALARNAIGRMPEGIYKMLWSYSGGDCGFEEYIIDGDRILEFNECKYRFEVRLFERVR